MKIVPVSDRYFDETEFPLDQDDLRRIFLPYARTIPLRRISTEDLQAALRAHSAWLDFILHDVKPSGPAYAADFLNMDLRYADLRNANLTFVDLRYADLSCADVRGATFKRAKTTCADFSFAKGLTFRMVKEMDFVRISLPAKLDARCRKHSKRSLLGPEAGNLFFGPVRNYGPRSKPKTGKAEPT